jgi:hypothetical protein
MRLQPNCSQWDGQRRTIVYKPLSKTTGISRLLTFSDDALPLSYGPDEIMSREFHSYRLSPTIFGATPAESKRVAQVWRRS